MDEEGWTTRLVNMTASEMEAEVLRQPQIVRSQKGSAAVTLLWQCASDGNDQAIRVLLDAGADAGAAKLDDGVSALYIAAQNGHFRVVGQLLGHDRGSDVNQPRDTGATPLLIATQKNHLDIVRLLLQYGASVSAKNSQGCSPFVLACSLGHTEIALELLDAGSDINDDSTGKKPLCWSRSGRHKTITLALQEIFVVQLRQKQILQYWMAIAAQRKTVRTQSRQEKEQAALRLQRIEQAREKLHGAKVKVAPQPKSPPKSPEPKSLSLEGLIEWGVPHPFLETPLLRVKTLGEKSPVSLLAPKRNPEVPENVTDEAVELTHKETGKITRSAAIASPFKEVHELLGWVGSPERIALETELLYQRRNHTGARSVGRDRFSSEFLNRRPLPTSRSIPEELYMMRPTTRQFQLRDESASAPSQSTPGKRTWK